MNDFGEIALLVGTLLAAFVLVALIATPEADPQGVNPSDVKLDTFRPDSKVYMRTDVAVNLLNVYDSVEKETPFCLHGVETENDEYVITRLQTPRMISSTEHSATLDNTNCANQSDYLGMIHNHPSGICVPSEIDIYRFMNDEDTLVEVIACNRKGSVEYFGIVIDTKLRKMVKF